MIYTFQTRLPIFSLLILLFYTYLLPKPHPFLLLYVIYNLILLIIESTQKYVLSSNEITDTESHIKLINIDFFSLITTVFYEGIFPGTHKEKLRKRVRTLWEFLICTILLKTKRLITVRRTVVIFCQPSVRNLRQVTKTKLRSPSDTYRLNHSKQKSNESFGINYG